MITSCRANYHAALIPIDFQLAMETILSTLLATLRNDMSKKTDTKHLKLRGNIWWYQSRIPKHLINQYPDQSFIQVSLETVDISEARKKRNVINGELESKCLRATTSTDGQRFRELVREMELKAYMTVNGARDFSRKYRLTLMDGYKMWLDDVGQDKTEEHRQKIEKAIKDFGKFCFKNYGWIDSPSLAIENIDRKMVYAFIKHLGKSYKKTTVQGTISRINTIWVYLNKIDEVKGNNPFLDHIYSSAEEAQSEKQEPFTKEEVKVIRAYKWEKPVYSLLVDLGIYTGCRISELCNFKKKHVVVDEGIVAINIEKGKTKAATRTVPLPDFMGNRLLEHIERKQEEDYVIGLSSKTASRTFSNFKTRHVTNNNLKSFHSFRHMYITAMERAGVEENVTAQIVGHERGKTMSYGYYSKGHELRKLSESVNCKRSVEPFSYLRS